MQSHIQMPKCVLKRFENQNERFYYYDVKKGIIGNNGHARSINTEFGYYSQNTEGFLRDYIETPFSELLCQIDRIDFDSVPFSKPSDFDVRVKRFIYALISRSPQMMSGIKKSSFFFQLLPDRDQHDYAAAKGIELAEQLNVFGDYFVTFAVNKSTMRFILPMCGLYNFKYNEIPGDSLLLMAGDWIAIGKPGSHDIKLSEAQACMRTRSTSQQWSEENHKELTGGQKTRSIYKFSNAVGKVGFQRVPQTSEGGYNVADFSDGDRLYVTLTPAIIENFKETFGVADLDFIPWTGSTPESIETGIQTTAVAKSVRQQELYQKQGFTHHELHPCFFVIAFSVLQDSVWSTFRPLHGALSTASPKTFVKS